MTDGQPTLTRLVLIRHGESKATVERRLAGFRTCTGLSPLGRRQAESLRERVRVTGELPADVLISSNFARAIETAEIIADAFMPDGVDALSIDDRFGEHDPGPDLDGLLFQEFIDRFGRPDRSDDPHRVAFAGGETTAEFQLRVGRATSEVVRNNEGGRIVVVCHGGVVDAVLRLLMRTPPTGAFELHTLNTSLTEFAGTPSGPWRLARYNDAAHLAGLPESTLAEQAASESEATAESGAPRSA